MYTVSGNLKRIEEEKRSPIGLADRGALETAYERNRPHYAILLRRLYRRMRNMLAKSGINATVTYRLKTFESYFEKLLRIQNAHTGDMILTDLLGFRVICPFLEDLEHVEDLITENFSLIEVERKGLNHSFREFGYDSIHLLIVIPENALPVPIPYTGRVCEIQLRTILQEAWAEIEHELVYKADFSLLNEPLKRKLASLNATLALSDLIFQEIRNYRKEVQKRGEKRRESLHEKAQCYDQISIMGTLEIPEAERKGYTAPIPFRAKGRLEKFLFEALESHSNGLYKKAIGIYSRILEMKPAANIRSIIYNHRGMAYFVLSEYDRSIHDFSKAIKHDQGNFRAYNNRALAYRMVHQYGRALEDFSRSLEINTYQAEAYHGRSLTYYDLHDFTKAIEDCERALSIKPDFSPAMRLKTAIEMKIFG